MKTLACLIVFVIYITAPSLEAQVPFFQQYHPLKRNQAVQVNSLLQDRSGFIWLGTNNGLFRFDGDEHRRFARADSLRQSEITALAQDTLGRIWSGHYDGSISYVADGTLRIFEHFT